MAIAPREIPTPSPISKLLPLPDPPDAGADVAAEVSARLADAISVRAVVMVVGFSVAVIGAVSRWELLEAAAVLRVAPIGVIKALVPAMVLSSTDEPTISE